MEMFAIIVNVPEHEALGTMEEYCETYDVKWNKYSWHCDHKTGDHPPIHQLHVVFEGPPENLDRLAKSLEM